MLACDGPPAAGPAVVELPAVSQVAFPVEEEEIGRAGGGVGLRHRLILIEEVGERVACLLDLAGHHLGTVGRVPCDIVRVDSHDGETLPLVLAGELRELGAQMLDEGAVVADERNEQARCVPEVVE